MEDRQGRRTIHRQSGSLAQSEPPARLSGRRALSRVQRIDLRHETDQPDLGRDPIGRGSIRPRAIFRMTVKNSPSITTTP